jgi:hypothetical protein
MNFAQRWRKAELRNFVALVFSALVVSSACFPQAKSATPEELVFRAPFTLKLHVDDERYYEQSFDRIPYVADNDVYLFVGEAFGLNVTVAENEVSHIAYERSPAKADVELRFTQEKSRNGWTTMLVIRNKLKRRLYLDALMTVPGKEEILKTNVLPVESNLSGFESWPHPIVQLVLQNFRFSEKPRKQTETAYPKARNVYMTMPSVRPISRSNGADLTAELRPGGPICFKAPIMSTSLCFLFAMFHPPCKLRYANTL